MIERDMIDRSATLFNRFSDSLFSISARAFDCKISPWSCELYFASRARGKSVDPEGGDPNWEALYDANVWTSAYTPSHGIVSTEFNVEGFIFGYLSTLRTIMEGKQGIVGFDLLSLGSWELMSMFEKKAGEIFGIANETLVIYCRLSGTYPDEAKRLALWERYLEYLEIAKEEWVLGF